jgi:methyl-accepting chemotaxis protein
VAEIAAASQEQSNGIQQVNNSVVQMDDITQQNASLVEEAAASQSMGTQAEELNAKVETHLRENIPYYLPQDVKDAGIWKEF